MSTTRPARAVIDGLKRAMAGHAPFSSMADADLERIALAARVRYYAPGETILAPGSTPVDTCYLVRQGRVRGERPGTQGDAVPVFELAPGEMFPLSAILATRGAGSFYRAMGDVFCLAFPASLVHRLAAESPPFQDFCTRRLAHLLDLSRERVQAEYASSVTGERGFGTALGSLMRGSPITVAPTSSLRESLETMEAKRIGSLPVVDSDGHPLGIFTRQDVIGRVVLPSRSLAAPISEVMTHPVITLGVGATAGDAAMLMARHGIRHVVVTDADGCVAGVLSERDLFALKRQSVRELASAIRRAPDLPALVQAAADIRALSHAMVAQGLASGPLTRMIANLNDVLTERVLELTAPRHDFSGIAFAWLGMGSEGRLEQTIATDQDNGIVFVANDAALGVDAIRERLLPFAREVNHALDACGYPLCKGEVMAMNPRWCASLDEWRATFAQWIDRGSPESLLASAIFFDFRALWGEEGLARTLRADIAARAARNPRFLKQMSDNTLATRPPLNWLGELSTDARVHGEPAIDIKRAGSMPFTDGARILALATGVTATNTVERLREAAPLKGVPADEFGGWIDAFEFVQMLRLRTQHRHREDPGAHAHPNTVVLADLSDLDRRILKEALRQARKLQQRLEADYPG